MVHPIRMQGNGRVMATNLAQINITTKHVAVVEEAEAVEVPGSGGEETEVPAADEAVPRARDMKKTVDVIPPGYTIKPDRVMVVVQ